jgi:TM2 domain-containing membrane protein YozV
MVLEVVGSLLLFVIFVMLLVYVTIPIRLSEEDKKRLNIARVLSVLFPGLGHILMGHVLKGIILMFLWITLGILNFIYNVTLLFAKANTLGHLLLNLSFSLVIWICSLIGLSGWRKTKQVQIEAKSL